MHTPEHSHELNSKSTNFSPGVCLLLLLFSIHVNLFGLSVGSVLLCVRERNRQMKLMRCASIGAVVAVPNVRTNIRVVRTISSVVSDATFFRVCGNAEMYDATKSKVTSKTLAFDHFCCHCFTKVVRCRNLIPPDAAANTPTNVHGHARETNENPIGNFVQFCNSDVQLV